MQRNIAHYYFFCFIYKRNGKVDVSFYNSIAFAAIKIKRIK